MRSVYYISYIFSNFRELPSSTDTAFTALETSEVRLQGSLPRLLAQDVHQGFPGALRAQGLPAGHAAPLHEAPLAQRSRPCAPRGAPTTPYRPFKNLPTPSSPRYGSIPQTPCQYRKSRRRNRSTPYCKKIHLTEKDTRRRTKGNYSSLTYFLYYFCARYYFEFERQITISFASLVEPFGQSKILHLTFHSAYYQIMRNNFKRVII